MPSVSLEYVAKPKFLQESDLQQMTIAITNDMSLQIACKQQINYLQNQFQLRCFLLFNCFFQGICDIFYAIQFNEPEQCQSVRCNDHEIPLQFIYIFCL